MFNRFMESHPFIGAVVMVLCSFAAICVAVWCEYNGYGMCEMLGLE